MDHVIIPVNPISSLIVAAAVFFSAWIWTTRKSSSVTSIPIVMGAIFGGFVGAKLGFVVAEAPLWWREPDFWARMLFGKTILGALLGGWIGVEFAKWVSGERRRLGDAFAGIIPLGIAAGRLGCLVHGCCQGRTVEELGNSWLGSGLTAMGLERWPAPVAEIIFQATFLTASWVLRDQKRLCGQYFHLYLIAYGLFRFAHEFVRDTPRYPGTDLSPYMLLALACVFGGAIGFAWRARREPFHEKVT
jgi:prolipoprotein diacylglyceryltransferase